MKNLLVSAFVAGALIVCPMAFADHNTTMPNQAESQKTESPVKKAKHKKRHAKKHYHRKHQIKKERQTRAEKEIEEATEFNNR